MAKKKIYKNSSVSIRQPLKPMIFVSICAAGLLIAMGLLFLYIFKADDLIRHGIEKQVFYILLIPLGLSAAAFLFGAMKGFAAFTGKVFSGKLEITGPGVVFFLVIILGFNLIPENRPFDFTIYLKDGEGKTVLKKDQAYVRLLLDNNPVTGQTDENGAVDFKGIPPKFMGSTVPVELEAKRWTFVNEKMSTTCVLQGNHAILVVQKDASISKLSGLVTDEEGRFIAGAKVVVKGIEANTDAKGWFLLKIPLEKQEEKQLVTIQKPGYKNKLEYAYPGDKTNPVFILEKEGD
ncbi:MAG: carboxypeptidase-like regulatory domain-containing protein [Candidatus Aminicenantes bacterium]|nr:carboxypeptidase-like regulatory domain-containing protein [Candidatus Aminicenantes bacterium]